MADVPGATPGGTGRYGISVFQYGKQVPLDRNIPKTYYATAWLKADGFDLVLPRWQCDNYDNTPIDLWSHGISIRTEKGERADMLTEMVIGNDLNVRLQDAHNAVFPPATGVASSYHYQRFLYVSEKYDLLASLNGHASFVKYRFTRVTDETLTVSIDSIYDFENDNHLISSGFKATLFISSYADECTEENKSIDVLELIFE